VVTFVNVEDLSDNTHLEGCPLRLEQGSSFAHDIYQVLDDPSFSCYQTEFTYSIGTYLRLQRLHFEQCLISRSKLVLDVVCSTHASEDTTMDKDTHFGGECLSLFHRMRCEYDTCVLSLLADAGDNLPHESSSCWVHTSRWLIKQHNKRVAEDGDGRLQFSLVSSRKLVCMLVLVCSQSEFLDHTIDQSLMHGDGQLLDEGVEL